MHNLIKTQLKNPPTLEANQSQTNSQVQYSTSKKMTVLLLSLKRSYNAIQNTKTSQLSLKVLNSRKIIRISCNYLIQLIIYRVDKNDDLKFLERGIALEEFSDMREKRKYEMEFRILQRMTQHKGHVKNLYNSPKMEFKKQNRYNEVLPCNYLSFSKYYIQLIIAE